MNRRRPEDLLSARLGKGHQDVVLSPRLCIQSQPGFKRWRSVKRQQLHLTQARGIGQALSHVDSLSLSP